MSNKQGFYGYNVKRQIVEFYVNEKKTPNFSFAPEIKSTEDMQVLARYGLALDEGSPIFIRCNFWDTLISSIDIPPYKRKDNMINGLSPELLIGKHSFLFYEPPELFHLTYPKILITHALGGDVLSSKNFKTKVRKITEREKINDALKFLPDFYRPFIERQFMKYLMFDKEEKDLRKIAENIYDKKELEQIPTVSQAWNDSKIDTSYPIHIAELLVEANKANKANNSALISPVPLLRRTSSNSDFESVNNFNITASMIRNALGNKFPHVYYHLYLDWKTTQSKSSGLNATSLLSSIEKTLEEGDFAGICLTLKGYESALKHSKFEYIQSFVSDLKSVAEYNYLPLVLPRSKWYGLKLFDCDINCFGSLLNGKPLYSKKSKGFKTSEGEGENKIDTHLDCGYTYIINDCVELDYDDTKKYLERKKRFPHVAHIPNTVDNDSWQGSKLFRINVSKPRRLSHMEEARYVRKDRTRDVINPASRYLEKSKNPYFGEK